MNNYNVSEQSLGLMTSKLEEEASFEVIHQFVGSSRSDSFGTPEQEEKNKSIGLSKLETSRGSSDDNSSALYDLTSQYSLNKNEELVENCIKISKMCLQSCRDEQIKLTSLISTVNEREINFINVDAGTIDDAIDNDSDAQSDETEKKAKQSAEDCNVQPKKASKFYNAIILAVVIGFIVSFVLFLTYTVVFESLKMKQIQTFENMTKEERQEKEKYRKETDNFRETLMHKSYEEARHSTDELKECLKTNDDLKVELTSMKNEVFRINLEARELENGVKVKVETYRKLLEDFQLKNKELNNELIAAKKSRNEYDFSVLFGLLVGLICVIFWGIRKY